MGVGLGEQAASGCLLTEIQFPVSEGTISIRWNSQGLFKEIRWQQNGTVAAQLPLLPRHIAEVVDHLRAYFEIGQPIPEIPWEMIDQSEWTDFQKSVYRVIASIPHGETRTYGWVAEKLRKGSAGRAVGQALRNNTMPILIPCHRVVSVTSIGGFMGCMDPCKAELRLKTKLINLEESYTSPMFAFLGLGESLLTEAAI